MRMSEPPSDADLLATAARDVAAFGELYDRYVDRVTGFAARRCASAEDVADAVAQTFVRLLGAAPSYDPERGEPGAGWTRLSRARTRLRNRLIDPEG